MIDPRMTKAPFPYFGGKRRAAAVVWDALGDPEHYVEPFAGSMAVLLERPGLTDGAHRRPYYSETVNDTDGLLVNFWRALRADPSGTAMACAWPVSEADLSARRCALHRWRQEGQLDHLAGDPRWYDLEMAAWWAWCAASSIGVPLPTGPWAPDERGHLTKMTREESKRRNAPENLAPPGTWRELPHVANNGQGLHHAATRDALEPPGTKRQLPHVASNGQGLHRPATRDALEPPADWRAECAGGFATPYLMEWFWTLADRLRWVRMLHGDWARACTDGVLRTLSVRGSKGGTAGVFLDPPYARGNRDGDLYAHDEGGTLIADVLAWCLAATDKPWLRVVLAGFEGDYGDPGPLVTAGWRCVSWMPERGHLTGGMNKDRTKQGRLERLWLSPSCLGAEPVAEECGQMALGEDHPRL